MFASEKVMLDYLGQLLSDKPESDIETKHVAQNAPAENYLDKSTEKLTTSAVNRVQDETILVEQPKLRPITSKVNELRDFKEDVVTLAEPNAVEKLLQQVELKQQEEKIIKEQVKSVDLEARQTIVETEFEKTEQAVIAEDVIPEEPFQALFFEVAGLVLAVPLQELGGIHNLTETNSLFGKPEWFKGVMLNREKKLNVVDSARWVMPEKFDKNMEESINYQYLITLGQSDWGLAAEKLVETELIHPDAVKWRTKQGKRPWLFGTIKEKMCALLHVSDLIAMLEQGIDARQQ